MSALSGGIWRYPRYQPGGAGKQLHQSAAERLQLPAADPALLFEFPNFGAIDQLESGGSSSYNSTAGSVRIQDLARADFAVLLHLVACAGGTGQQFHAAAGQHEIRGDYGNSSNDVRHQFKGYLVYDVPGAKRGPKWLSRGWQLNSLLYLRTGRPVIIRAASATSGTLEGTERANIVGDPFQGVDHTFVPGKSLRWFTPAAFVNPASGQFGSMQKNSVYGPGFATVDLSVFKNIPIRERLKAQFRVGDVQHLQSRQSGSAQLSRGQFARAHRIYAGRLLGQPGIGPGEPFNMQLALKFVF